MSAREQTITEFMIAEQRRFPAATGDFTALLNYVRLACKRISFIVGRGALAGIAGSAQTVNVQGETQVPLDVIANDIFLRTGEYGGHLAGMVSEELAEPYAIPDEYPRGRYLLSFDPLDGSSNIDINAPVGSIFSVLRAPRGSDPPSPEDFMQPGAQQLGAGYAIYGATTMIVLTVGRGVHGFTLDRGFGEFILTHPDMRIPEETSEFAINASNERFWEPPVRRYVIECLAGKSGVRGKDFNMRWIASLVAEVHRILIRGGLFMYPRDTKDPQRPGRLRLLYEANPMAMLIEQAGGAASTGRARVLDLVPDGLHQRVPLVLGCRQEVERIERYHAEHDQGLDAAYSSPLFKERSLFIQN
ncbi:MAG: class 1 fructose-bisphosphatase [Gammaproteobacteria bacterium]|nr:class 1 fructose-bisphosphatase [Gammaproteobacteria bacterium]MDE2348549.1 class 1 fructose-bisphosphatase [Gammaproteobacteria bacterium]